MSVSAIVVTYNRLGGLKRNLRCLFKQTYKPNIVIINNKSSDGTKEYLTKFDNDKNVIVKNMTKNVGGSGGFSEGIRLAFEKTNSDYFWLMDDDALPTPTALENLVKGAKQVNNKFGFLCSNVRWSYDDSPIPPEIDHNWSELLPGNLVRVKKAMFVSFMVSRNSVANFGLPVRQMFIWGDDAEYSLRLHRHLPCYFVANSIVQHNASPSNNSPFNMAPTRDKYLRYDFRNELFAYRKNSNTKGLILQIIKELYFIIRIPFKSKHRKLKKLGYTISGFIKGFFFNPKIEFPNKK